MKTRRLILMRHATAGAGGGADALRRLTERGQMEAQRVGERLDRLGLIPDRVLCSSATRCRETWQAVSRAFEATISVDFEETLYNASARGLADAVAGVADTNADAETLLLLAHNPGISLLAFELGDENNAQASRLRGGFAPATIACFEVDGSWSLVSRRTVRLSHFEAPASE